MAKTTKLLGTSFAAGARRSVQTLQARITKVKQSAHRAQQLARLGLSAIDYVRGAAIPAMLYGCDTMGVADSMVNDACVVAAEALAPPTSGKKPTLVLHAASVHSQDVNPAMTANVLPIKAWSTAWWEAWKQPDMLMDTFIKADAKIARATSNKWAAVSGPASAVVATCARLGWRSDDGRVFTDDVGNVLDAALDPPKAFANAARRSTIRHNTDEVMKILPAARPEQCDVPFHSTFGAHNSRLGGRRTVLVDLVPYLKPLYKGSKKLATKLPQWTAQCSGYLTSAISGGQWPQVRKAKLPKFEGSDKCQLCHAEVGTLQHRHNCPVIKPSDGWTPLDEAAHDFVSRLSEGRRTTLATRGLMTVKVPIPEPQTATPGWDWLVAPPGADDDDLTWVIDGSRRFATDWILSTTGCGVAVLGRGGQLIAYATATPPPWVKTASAAEAWALWLTLKENPFPPHVLTDCMGLVNAAKAGPALATKGSKADARIWKQIDTLTGDGYRGLRDKLVWMPAHTSASGAVGRVKSDGQLLTTSEWRANDLADRLAKKGAASTPLRVAADATIQLAGSALLQAGARLGAVTLAANCHKVWYTKPNGELAYKVTRDSTAPPQAVARAKLGQKLDSKAAAAALCPAAAKPATVARPLVALTVEQQRRLAKRTLAASTAASLAAAQLTQVGYLVGEATANSRPQPLSAAERLDALRARRGLLPLQPGPPPPPEAAALSSAEAATWTFFGADA